MTNVVCSTPEIVPLLMLVAAGFAIGVVTAGLLQSIAANWRTTSDSYRNHNDAGP